MDALKTLLFAAALATPLGFAAAEQIVPAWQTPGYVMEEVVVTAPAPEIDLPVVVPEAPELYRGEPVVNARIPAPLAYWLALREARADRYLR